MIPDLVSVHFCNVHGPSGSSKTGTSPCRVPKFNNMRIPTRGQVSRAHSVAFGIKVSRLLIDNEAGALNYKSFYMSLGCFWPGWYR